MLLPARDLAGVDAELGGQLGGGLVSAGRRQGLRRSKRKTAPTDTQEDVRLRHAAAILGLSLRIIGHRKATNEKKVIPEILKWEQDRVMVVDVGPCGARGDGCVEFWGEPTRRTACSWAGRRLSGRQEDQS